MPAPKTMDSCLPAVVKCGWRLFMIYPLAFPIPGAIPSNKAKLATKIGGEYLLWKIGKHHWEKAAAEWKLDPDRVSDRIIRIASAMPEAVREVGDTMAIPGRAEAAFLSNLMAGIRERSEDCLRLFTGAKKNDLSPPHLLPALKQFL